MEKERTYLTLFHSSNWELGLAMSWRLIALKDVEEDGGFVIIQVETDQTSEFFEQYEHLFCTSYKSFPFRCQIIYFSPLFNSIEEVRSKIYKDLKLIAVNTKADQFQM